MASPAPKNFEISIDPSGKVSFHSKGAKGSACHDWADLMVEILGRQESRLLTGEFYESAEEHAKRTLDNKTRR
ncbi:MAG TPA: DUF2997 domain-containing protein [Tepidisphaeraceae bacterium]|jgi:hypothetical protein|nr:DUF2997 domain-containing protein [Tepidisphaeraceae bacterium]